MKRILFSLLLIPYIIFGQQNTSGSTKWYRVMGDQLEIYTQYELKEVARENNIQFEAFINQYGFSKEEPLMYFLSGDEIVSITWWAAKDQAKAQTTGFEQFKREVGLTFDYEKVSRQRDYVLSQQKKPKKIDDLKSNEVAPQKRTAVPNYKSNNSDLSSNYDNGETKTLVFIIVLVIIILFIFRKEKNKNANNKIKPLYKKPLDNKFNEENKSRIKKPNQIDFKVIEGIKNEFKKSLGDFKDDEDLNYWYKIIQADANSPLVAFSKENKENWSLEQEILTWLWGHDEEYELKMGSDKIENKTEFIKMRIIAFGEILSLLEKCNNRFISLRDDEGLDVLSEIEVLNFEIGFAKARLYGSIKFALRHQIDKDEIRLWYKGFLDNDDLYVGLNPFSLDT